MSILKPDQSVVVALGVSAGVLAIYSNLPSVPDIRVSEPNDEDLGKTERAAALMSIAFVGGVAAVTKDPTVFVIGGLAMIGISWWHKHANAFDPATGRVSGAGQQPIGLTYAQMADQATADSESASAY